MNNRIDSYFLRLNDLETGDRAAMKRASGKMLRDADGKALRVFYRCIPPTVSEWEADRWFAAGCLHCLWDADAGKGTVLEKQLRALLQSGDLSGSVGHRIESLLDTPWDADGYLLAKLTRLIKLVKQKSDAVVDCRGLLKDLLFWNGESQGVQRKWARTIFGEETENAENKEN